MYAFRKSAILLLTLLSITSVDAVTLNGSGMYEMPNQNAETVLSASNADVYANSIDISSCIHSLTMMNEYNIFVDGDLYLDYSVFNHDQSSIFIDSVITLNSSGVSIFSYNQEPAMPDLLVTSVFQNPGLTINESGSVLLFSDAPIRNGVFQATNNIYIGNYSSIQPVPLPASLMLFLAGLGMLIGKMSLAKRIG